MAGMFFNPESDARITRNKCLVGDCDKDVTELTAFRKTPCNNDPKKLRKDCGCCPAPWIDYRMVDVLGRLWCDILFGKPETAQSLTRYHFICSNHFSPDPAVPLTPWIGVGKTLEEIKEICRKHQKYSADIFDPAELQAFRSSSAGDSAADDEEVAGFSRRRSSSVMSGGEEVRPDTPKRKKSMEQVSFALRSNNNWKVKIDDTGDL